MDSLVAQHLFLRKVTTTGTVTLNTLQGGVTELSNSIISADKLLLLGTGTYTLAQANTVGTLAANLSGSLVYHDANTLTVGTVVGTSGISTNGNDVTLVTGDLITLGTGAGEDIVATTVRAAFDSGAFGPRRF